MAVGVFSVLSSSVPCLTTLVVWLSEDWEAGDPTPTLQLSRRDSGLDQGKWLDLLILFVPFQKGEVTACNFCILSL